MKALAQRVKRLESVRPSGRFYVLSEYGDGTAVLNWGQVVNVDRFLETVSEDDTVIRIQRRECAK